MYKTLLLPISLLITSCSSSLIVDIPYTDAQQKISGYFNAPSKYDFDRTTNLKEELRTKKKLGAHFSQNRYKSKWVHIPAPSTNKQAYVTPTVVTVTLKKASKDRSKIYIDVIQRGLIFSERLNKQQNMWLQTISHEVKKDSTK